MQVEEPGRVFREAWIEGVRKHYSGEPKPGYVTPWDDTPEWERESAAAVYEQVRQFIEAADGATAKLTREQKGRFVALCWIAQIFKHFQTRRHPTWPTGQTCRSGSKRRTRTSSNTSSRRSSRRAERRRGRQSRAALTPCPHRGPAPSEPARDWRAGHYAVQHELRLQAVTLTAAEVSTARPGAGRPRCTPGSATSLAAG